MSCLCSLFFFKHKTAYEMRISDWSSDVCSSDLVSGSAILTLWALLGFESASVAADKVENPTVTIPRATIIGTLATGVLYLIVCSAIALMPPAAAVATSEAPFARFAATTRREPCRERGCQTE